MSDSIVIIPTYNERENVERIIRAVFDLQTEHPFHVLIIEDGSPDGTAAIVKGMQQEPKLSDKLHMIERTGKLGLGTAYITGFKWCLQNGYEYIFEMDADFSHPPAKLLELRKACAEDGADVSVGSRYVPGGKLVNWPWDRVFLSKGASLYVRMITWMWVMDPTAGFVCYTRGALERLDFNKIRFVGYAFQIEMKYSLRLLGCTIKEVPITFTDRVEGTSKMSGGIIKEAIFGVIKMRLTGSKKFYSRT